MTKYLASIATAALLAAAACSKPAAPADDLANDLKMANGSGIELAPHTAGTQVVSEIEQTPGSTPNRAPRPVVQPRRVAPTPQRTAPVVVAQAPAVAVAPTKAPEPEQTTVAVQSPEPTPEPVIATPRPTPAPRGRAAPRGGWSSVSDVIRNAPFPVTP